ncbi:hypothetical protein [Desulfonema magnum]|uniref:hypothetical protein n=1 Tax=Desulfonema magnum TaxID=45655 RepID=UPI001A9A85CF|nr:hypothetical protein [Desulfonema magnum]
MSKPFPPYHQATTQPQSYYSCTSGDPQAQAYNTAGQYAYYPQHDQNYYQYSEGYEYGYPPSQNAMAVPYDWGV